MTTEQKKPPSRLKLKLTVAALAASLIGGFEGLRTTAYRDLGGVPTVCYGETEGVSMGDRYTPAQCKEMLIKSLEKYAQAVESCIKRPMPDTTYVAFVSFTYNLGEGAFCRSSIVRHYNNGDVQRACDTMLLYNKVKQTVFPGLQRRREAERKLCLQGGSL